VVLLVWLVVVWYGGEFESMSMISRANRGGRWARVEVCGVRELEGAESSVVRSMMGYGVELPDCDCREDMTGRLKSIPSPGK
jgi:hypothetical protein